MKIFKIAQDQGVPDGHVRVKVTIGDDGSFKATVVEHGAGTACGQEDDDAIVGRIANKIGTTTDAGLTSEGFEDTRVKEPQEAVQEEEAPFAGGQQSAPEAPGRELDLGYGA